MLQQSSMDEDRDSSDDFQSVFRRRMTEALADIAELRDYRESKRRPSKRKRGPEPKSVRMMFYLLPDGSEMPKFTRKDPLIETHQNHGFGYPAVYYSDFKGKYHPMDLNLNEEEFKERIRSLYQKLFDKDFLLFTVDRSKKLFPAPFCPSYFKDLKYKGRVIIKLKDTIIDEQRSPSAAITTRATTASTLSPVTVTTRATIATISPPITVSTRATTSNPVPITTIATAATTSTPVTITTISTTTTTTLPPVTISTRPTAATTSPPVTNTTTTSSSRVPQNLFANATTSQPFINPSTWTNKSTQTMESVFRDEVSINPRHRLVLQQDLEFAQSLAIDREKDFKREESKLRRNLLRTERIRQRELRKEQQEKLQTAAVEEVTNLRCYGNAEDMISIVFVLPSEQQARRLISKLTPSDKLHLYVEACFGVLSAKLLLGSTVLDCNQQTISALGLNANSRITVEESIMEDSEESGSDSDEEDTDVTLAYNPTHLNDIAELERRQTAIYEHLLPEKQVTIRRETILNDVMDTYRLDPSIVHHKLKVTFEGEEKALDMDGVTREMFSSTIPLLLQKYFLGHMKKVPASDLNAMLDGTFNVIGQIIAHGYVLVNYLPPALSPVVFSVLGSGECSDELLLQCFLDFITEEESAMLKDALKATLFDEQTRIKLINFSGEYNGREVPTPETLKPLLIKLAKYHQVIQPLYAISQLAKGLAVYPLLFQGVTEKLITQKLQSYYPTAQKVIDMITYNFSEDIVFRCMEERVKGYLERFILSCSNRQLPLFLKFWCSVDTLCLNSLTVEFNSLTDTQRRPIANTCTSTLQVSRMYLSAAELAEEFNIFVFDKVSNVFDSI